VSWHDAFWTRRWQTLGAPMTFQFRIANNPRTVFPMRVGRIAAVTASLAAIGAVVGAVLGAIVLTAWALVRVQGDVGSIAFVGAWTGAVIGMVLAPTTTWGFLRRVPIGKALAYTATGTAVGAFAGLLIGGLTVDPLSGGLIGSFVGFVAAAIVLRLTTRRAAGAPTEGISGAE
jgi:hypothetical protein